METKELTTIAIREALQERIMRAAETVVFANRDAVEAEQIGGIELHGHFHDVPVKKHTWRTEV